jgi:hypothetical protein
VELDDFSFHSLDPAVQLDFGYVTLDSSQTRFYRLDLLGIENHLIGPVVVTTSCEYLNCDFPRVQTQNSGIQMMRVCWEPNGKYNSVMEMAVQVQVETAVRNWSFEIVVSVVTVSELEGPQKASRSVLETTGRVRCSPVVSDRRGLHCATPQICLPNVEVRYVA